MYKICLIINKWSPQTIILFIFAIVTPLQINSVSKPKFYRFIPGPWTLIAIISLSLMIWLIWLLVH